MRGHLKMAGGERIAGQKDSVCGCRASGMYIGSLATNSV